MMPQVVLVQVQVQVQVGHSTISSALVLLSKAGIAEINIGGKDACRGLALLALAMVLTSSVGRRLSQTPNHYD